MLTSFGLNPVGALENLSMLAIPHALAPNFIAISLTSLLEIIGI